MPRRRCAAHAAPQAESHTLPADVASFTGRDVELKRLVKALPDGTETGGVVPIDAIDGMAGIGKTAFAVHVAHQLASRFPDGHLFLRLHAHTLVSDQSSLLMPSRRSCRATGWCRS